MVRSTIWLKWNDLALAQCSGKDQERTGADGWNPREVCVYWDLETSDVHERLSQLHGLAQ